MLSQMKRTVCAYLQSHTAIACLEKVTAFLHPTFSMEACGCQLAYPKRSCIVRPYLSLQPISLTSQPRRDCNIIIVFLQDCILLSQHVCKATELNLRSLSCSWLTRQSFTSANSGSLPRSLLQSFMKTYMKPSSSFT